MKLDPWRLDLETLFKRGEIRGLLCYGNELDLKSHIFQNVLEHGQGTLLTEKEFIKDPDAFGQPDLFSKSREASATILAIEDVQDRNTGVYQERLENHSPNDPFFLLFGPSLRTSSRMVHLFQTSKTLIALPCYAMAHEHYAQLLIQTFKCHPILSKAPKAWVSDLATQLPLGSLRDFIQKVSILYADHTCESPTALEACLDLIQPQTQDLKPLPFVLSEKKVSQFIPLLGQLGQDATEGMAVLRQCIAHFLALLQVKGLTQQGHSVEQAMKQLSPPVFFKHQAIFKAHLSLWSLPQLYTALEYLAQGELAFKKNNTFSSCSHHLMNIATL